MKLTQQQFVDQFIVQFLATWCANEFEYACMNGEHERMHKPPVEDAKFLAEKAWEYYQEVLS